MWAMTIENSGARLRAPRKDAGDGMASPRGGQLFRPLLFRAAAPCRARVSLTALSCPAILDRVRLRPASPDGHARSAKPCAHDACSPRSGRPATSAQRRLYGGSVGPSVSDKTDRCTIVLCLPDLRGRPAQPVRDSRRGLMARPDSSPPVHATTPSRPTFRRPERPRNGSGDERVRPIFRLRQMGIAMSPRCPYGARWNGVRIPLRTLALSLVTDATCVAPHAASASHLPFIPGSSASSHPKKHKSDQGGE